MKLTRLRSTSHSQWTHTPNKNGNVTAYLRKRDWKMPFKWPHCSIVSKIHQGKSRIYRRWISRIGNCRSKSVYGVRTTYVRSWRTKFLASEAKLKHMSFKSPLLDHLINGFVVTRIYTNPWDRLRNSGDKEACKTKRHVTYDLTWKHPASVILTITYDSSSRLIFSILFLHCLCSGAAMLKWCVSLALIFTAFQFHGRAFYPPVSQIKSTNKEFATTTTWSTNYSGK